MLANHLTDEEKKELVTSSFAKVEPISAVAATLFYNKLWELDPDIKEMFSDTDMEKQKEKLMRTLSVAVDMLNDMDGLTVVLQDLGRKHVEYGTKDEQYNTVGAALLFALEQGLGEDFTDDVQAAWTWVYGVMAGIMMDAAHGAQS